MAQLLARAGVHGTTLRGLIGVCALCGAVGLVVALMVTATPIAVVAGVAAWYTPIAVIRGRAAAWPEPVGHLASAVRAGMSSPDWATAPEPLREPFAAIARDYYQASGPFAERPDSLKARLANPGGDLVVDTACGTRRRRR